jgi:hypothetical protein
MSYKQLLDARWATRCPKQFVNDAFHRQQNAEKGHRKQANEQALAPKTKQGKEQQALKDISASR